MRLQAISIILLLTISNFLESSDDHIVMFTEQSPPHNMMVDGKVTGSSVEILDAIFKQMKSKQSLEDVRLTNWARGYIMAQRFKNTMLFSTMRTKERDKLFKWVGPISAKTRVGLIALKRKNIKINKISDLNKYKIGTIFKDIGESLLLSYGVDKNALHYVKGENALGISIKKMDKNKIDMFSHVLETVFGHIRMQGLDANKYETVYVLQKSELYFAFNKNTDDIIIDKWQKALDEIKHNGLYEKILRKYKKKNDSKNYNNNFIN